MAGALDTDDMRRRAAECRILTKTAVPSLTAGDQWLKAAEQWDQLAGEVDAWRTRCALTDRVAKVDDAEVQ